MNATLTPPAEAERPLPEADPPAAPEPAATEGKSKPTEYVIVAVIHRGEGTEESPTNDTTLMVKVAEDIGTVEHPTQGVPFIVGGWETPEVYPSRSGPASAKMDCLIKHPELRECVTTIGLSLAAWPKRSYEFKAVEFDRPEPKLRV